MKYIIVLTLKAKTPDEIAEALKKIDPESIPGFAGTARIAIDPVASQVEKWLDADK